LLASQLEDADTLFFQRRLIMTGDTALGLQVRNFMDQLPASQLPPGLRILMNRLARLALAAKRARA
jgi:predicted lipid carrier protein YhbT